MTEIARWLMDDPVQEYDVVRNQRLPERNLGPAFKQVGDRIPSKVLGSICIAEGNVSPHTGQTRVRSGRVVVSIPWLSACVDGLHT